MQNMQKNPAQEEAIHTVNGPMLLISCPGSGKTTTMLRRIDYMIRNGVDPKHILMVTFTDAAATEMKKRFRTQYGNHPVTFCTIHALCLRVLHLSGGPAFTIMDASARMDAMYYAARLSHLTFDDFKDITNDVSRFKNTGVYDQRSEQSINDQQFLAFVKGYESYKDEHGLLDFDDMLIRGKQILKENGNLLTALKRQFTHIICDEYQDTNPIQRDILYLMAGDNGNLCVVGDDDQSIYGFRGAVPSIMMDFQKDFPACKTIRMSTNYRSVPGIIGPAGMMIKYNRVRFDKDIQASRDTSANGRVYYETADDREQEIEQLVGLVRSYCTDGHYQNCAVLARTNMQLEQVSEAFMRNKIPFTSKDVVTDIYEHWCFQDLCSYLSLADGTGTVHDLKRILNRPARYIPMASFHPDRISYKYEDGQVLRAFSNLKPYVLDNVLDLVYQIKKMRSLPFHDRIPFIMKEIGYDRYLEQYTEKAGLADVSLFAKCGIFSRDAATCVDLTDWKAYAKNHIYSFKQSVRDHKEDGVILATMHRSKGLEWDHVFVIDCCAGTVPFQRRKNDPLTDASMEEERRLFYVACTRAKETLHVMRYAARAGKRGGQVNVPASPFIRELRTSSRQPVTQAEKSQLRKKAKAVVLSGFKGADISTFRPGNLICHDIYGNGRVRQNSDGTLMVLFVKGGLKIFKY